MAHEMVKETALAGTLVEVAQGTSLGIKSFRPVQTRVYFQRLFLMQVTLIPWAGCWPTEWWWGAVLKSAARGRSTFTATDLAASKGFITPSAQC